MNKSELIEAVAARAGSDSAAARRHVDALFETIMANVASGDRILVTGFGTFDSFERPARQARNPRTGLPIAVAAAQVPRFRIGQTFKNRVANGGAAAIVVEEIAPAVAEEPVANGRKAKKGGGGKAKKAETPKKVEAAKQADAPKKVDAAKKPKKAKVTEAKKAPAKKGKGGGAKGGKGKKAAKV